MTKQGLLDFERTHSQTQKINANSVKRLISETKIALLKSNLESIYKLNRRNKFKNFINCKQSKINFKLPYPKLFHSRYKSPKIPTINFKIQDRENFNNKDWGPW